MSIRNKQIMVAVIIFLILNVVFIAGAYAMKYQMDLRKVNSQPKKTETTVVTETDVKAPILINQNPNSALINEEYSFYPHLSDEDSDNSQLSVSLVSAPTWINLEDGKLYGVPSESDLGNAKVVLRLSDGKNSSDIPIYILVKRS